MASNTERLNEVILDLERSKVRETGLREETDALLLALGALISSTDADVIFNNLIEVFQKILNFKSGFILFEQEDGYDCHYSSNTKYLKTTWKKGDFFQRVSDGTPLAAFDIDKIDEWNKQDAEFKKDVLSALHIPLNGVLKKAIFVCTHPEKGYFSRRSRHLALKFMPVATQALILQEKNEAFQKEIYERNKIEKELKYAQDKLVQKAYVEGIAVNAVDILHSIGNTLTPLMICSSQLKQDKTIDTVHRFLEHFKNKIREVKKNGEEAHLFDDKFTIESFYEALNVVTERTDNYIKNSKTRYDKISTYIEQISNTVKDQRKFVDNNHNDKDTFVIKEFMKAIYDSLVPVAIQHRFDLQFSPNLGSEEITIERNSFHHCITNLITNSFDSLIEKSSKDNKFIGTILFSIQIVNKELILSIEDNGMGIVNTPEESLFKLGFTTKKEGTGFGLHNVSNFINSNGGNISLSSEGENCGAKAIIRLPIN